MKVFLLKKKLLIYLISLFVFCVDSFAAASTLESDFSHVCQFLAEHNWLADDYSQQAIPLDNTELPLKNVVRTPSEHVELIITKDKQPFQYGFFGNLDSAENLMLCISACSIANADSIAQRLWQSYENSCIYHDKHPSDDLGLPLGAIISEGIRYELSGNWLFIFDMQAFHSIFNMN